ncbi:hypothetical protein D9758_001727 [Tetrapyrgos nigripes]|uniref:Uncharacterized protein n=1 Tax=Tetrapyrgos nigripes TaxID=182062 RepID=A0A8H5LXJ6_9AGAR|nr:hypothetical protein D9758_001727 [Tetrapyrgos nigripes]
MMATTLDNYDTQMMDYSADIDVQMHPTDSWFQDEAAMEADTEATQYSSADGEFVDVEVDMDHDEGFQNPEYEMTDSAEYYPPEVEDAIVTDASHPVDSIGTNPSIIHSDVLPLQTVDYAVGEVGLPVQSNHQPPPGEVQPLQSHDTIAENSGLQDVQVIDTSVPEYSDHIPAATLQTDHSEPLEVAEPALGVPLPETAPSGESVVAPGDHYAATQSASEEPAAIAIAVPDPSLLHGSGADGGEDNPVSEVLQAQGVTTDPVDSENVLSSETDNDRLPPEAQAEPLYPPEMERPAEAAQPGPLPPSEETNAETQSGETLEANDSGVSAEAQQGELDQDPHEVSDGVYIDPPPAVLLTLALVDHRDVCLFNQPAQTEPSTSSETIKSYELLLHDQPTLYYEPLSKVFDALRGNGPLSQLVDLTRAELVLDAYDLQLVISEDNIFARETNLHDLNVLHDYSGISGPLRLRLQSVTPRFITRYRSLQEQLLQLNMTTGYVEESRDEGQEQFSEYDEEQEEYDQGENQPSEETQEPEGDLQPQVDNEDDRGDEVPADEITAPEESERPQQEEDAAAGAQAGDDLSPEDAPHDTEDVPHATEGQSNEAEAAERNVASVENPSTAPSNEAEAAETEEFTPDDDQEDAQTVQETADDVSQLTVEEIISEEYPSEEAQAAAIGDETEPTEQARPEDLPDTETTSAPNQEQPDDPSEEFDPPLDDSYQAEEDNVHTEGGLKDNLASPEDEFYEWEDESYNEEADNTVLEVEHEASSAKSSTTLSSKTSKRSFEDVDVNEDEEPQSAPSSPGSKRLRTE